MWTKVDLLCPLPPRTRNRLATPLCVFNDFLPRKKVVHPSSADQNGLILRWSCCTVPAVGFIVHGRPTSNAVLVYSDDDIKQWTKLMFPLLILGCMCCFFDFYILHHEDENRGATVRRSGSDKFMSEPYVSLLKYLIIFCFWGEVWNDHVRVHFQNLCSVWSIFVEPPLTNEGAYTSNLLLNKSTYIPFVTLRELYITRAKRSTVKT